MTPPSLPPWPVEPPTAGEVTLREVGERDVAMAMALSRDPSVSATSSLPPDADEAAARSWIARQRGRHAEGAGYSFTIELRGTLEPVGHCGVWTPRWAQRRASIGYAVVPSARGRGIGTDAVRALVAFAWTLRDLEAIDAFIEPDNRPSIAIVERAGFSARGQVQDLVTRGGTVPMVQRFVLDRPEPRPD